MKADIKGMLLLLIFLLILSPASFASNQGNDLKDFDIENSNLMESLAHDEEIAQDFRELEKQEKSIPSLHHEFEYKEQSRQSWLSKKMRGTKAEFAEEIKMFKEDSKKLFEELKGTD